MTLVTAILALTTIAKWDIENKCYFTHTEYIIWEF